MSDHEHWWSNPAWDLRWDMGKYPRLICRCVIKDCGATLAWEPPWYISTLTTASGHAGEAH